MVRGRKSGCPVNIKDWLVEILEPGSKTNWVRIYGLDTLTYSTSGETEDGSASTETWSEPYITKRSGSLSLDGKKVVVSDTGEVDPGQDLLDYYARQAGCESDATIRFIDPYGHGFILDCVVTDSEESANETEHTRSWSLEQVGEAEDIPYVQVTNVEAKIESEAKTELTMTLGDGPKLVEVAFTPEDASNKRFRVSNSKPRGVRVGDITEKGFTITPLTVCQATVTVTSINNAKTATITVTVNAAGD